MLRANLWRKLIGVDHGVVIGDLEIEEADGEEASSSMCASARTVGGAGGAASISGACAVSSRPMRRGLAVPPMARRSRSCRGHATARAIRGPSTTRCAGSPPTARSPPCASCCASRGGPSGDHRPGRHRREGRARSLRRACPHRHRRDRLHARAPLADRCRRSRFRPPRLGGDRPGQGDLKASSTCSERSARGRSRSSPPMAPTRSQTW